MKKFIVIIFTFLLLFTVSSCAFIGYQQEIAPQNIYTDYASAYKEYGYRSVYIVVHRILERLLHSDDIPASSTHDVLRFICIPDQ